MSRTQSLLAILLSACLCGAHAEPVKSQGSARIQNNLAGNRSDGKASSGLTTALSHISAEHGKESPEHARDMGRMERTEHAVKPELPQRPSR